MVAVVGLLVAYYALPLFLAIISLGEICAYSPLGTNLCGESTGESSGPPRVPAILREVVACKEDGIRYIGTTPEGAEVCLTVSSNGRELVETGFSFVRGSGCPNGDRGAVHDDSPAAVDRSGHVESKGLTATIRGAKASGVFADPEICRGKKFKSTAHRAP